MRLRILITGSLGYVAPGLIHRLRAVHPDAELIGVDTGWFAAELVGRGPAPESLLDRQIFADVRDADTELFTDVTHVIHLAAISNDPMGDRYADLTDQINFHESVRLCRLARDAGARTFTFASSGSVYGAGGDLPRNEESSLAPLTAYARSKIATEEAILPLARDEFAVTCLRFATACGWSPRPRLDLVLNDFVASALTIGSIEVLSDGTPWRPLIHVRDMARAIEWAVSNERLALDRPALVTNVGSDSWNYQIRDLAFAVQEATPGVEVHINTEAPADKRSYRVDFSRWRELAPSHQPAETLVATARELATNLEGALLPGERFREGRLTRLHVLHAYKEAGLLDDDLRWVREGVPA